MVWAIVILAVVAVVEFIVIVWTGGGPDYYHEYCVVQSNCQRLRSENIALKAQLPQVCIYCGLTETEHNGGHCQQLPRFKARDRRHTQANDYV